MSSVIDKLKTVVWFIKNPNYFPQIFQILKRRNNAKFEDSREESTKWCKENAISIEAAFKKLGVNIEYNELKNIFPDVLHTAKELEQNCLVNMGGEGAISFLYSLCKSFNVKRAVESGVAYGWSSLAILLALKDDKDSFLISNDMPYIKMNNEDYVGCVVLDEYRSKWQLQRLPDVTGLPKIFRKLELPLDLFHYDSDKSYSGRMWASPLIWNSLKVGGLFVSDDINDNLAFRHFSKKVEREPVIIEHLGKYVGLIIK